MYVMSACNLCSRNCEVQGKQAGDVNAIRVPPSLPSEPPRRSTSKLMNGDLMFPFTKENPPKKNASSSDDTLVPHLLRPWQMFCKISDKREGEIRSWFANHPCKRLAEDQKIANRWRKKIREY